MLNWRKDKTGEGEAVSASGSRLGDVLIEEGLVSEGQVADALTKAEKDGTFLGQALVESGRIQQNDLITCLVKKCKIPHLSLLDYDISDDLVSLLSQEVCQRYHLVPIDKLGKILTVAMVDPLDEEALAIIREACPDLKIKPILCDWNHYRQVTTRQFGHEQGSRQQEVSMASLGLGALAKAKPKEEPAAQPEAAAPPPSSPADTPDTASGGMSTEQVNQAFQTAVRERLGGLGEEIRQAVALQTAAPAPDMTAALGELSTALQTGMKQALQEAMTAALMEVRAAPAPAAGGTGPSAQDLSVVIQDSLRGVMQETVSALAERTAPPGGAVSDSSAREIAAAVQESVGYAVRESMGALVEEIRETRMPGVESVKPASDGTNRVRNEQSQELSEIASRVMQAAEAAIEATHAAQALKASQAEESAEERLERVARFTTVRPFGMHGGGEPDDEQVRAALDADCPIEGFTFDGFIISKSNEFTAKMCQTIADSPGSEHNPFFLYGPVGVGKTHLINATGNAIHKANGERRVGYVSAGRFAEKLLEARQAHASDIFRDAYSHWDVLILDDIQFLGGAVEAQEEFFHIFNALHQAGRQIIIAADKAPDELGHLEQRLVSRFAGGIVAPLAPPDHNSRMAILRRQAEAARINIDDEVMAVIATRIPGDVRRLVGAMRKVIAFGSVVGQDITSEMAYKVLGHLGAAEAAP